MQCLRKWQEVLLSCVCTSNRETYTHTQRHTHSFTLFSNIHFTRIPKNPLDWSQLATEIISQNSANEIKKIPQFQLTYFKCKGSHFLLFVGMQPSHKETTKWAAGWKKYFVIKGTLLGCPKKFSGMPLPYARKKFKRTVMYNSVDVDHRPFPSASWKITQSWTFIHKQCMYAKAEQTGRSKRVRHE